MPRKLMIWGIIVLLLFAAGCRTVPAAANRESQPGGTVVIGQLAEPETLNPLFGQPGAAARLIFSGLFQPKAGGEYEPDLASEVPTEANGGVKAAGGSLIVTYRLRPDARWQDGEELTAADVVFTYQVLKSYRPDWLTPDGYGAVTAITAVDSHTVEVTFGRADAKYLALFDWVLPAHILQGTEDIKREAFNRSPVGSGPYKLLEWIPRDRMVLAANPDYYGEMPRLDTIVFKQLPDRATAITALKTGQIDVFAGIAPEEAKSIDAAYGVTMHATPGAAPVNLELGWQIPLLQDPAVREAVRLAIDRQNIADAVYAGFAAPAPGSRDVAGARQRLEAAGWVSGEDGIFVKGGVRLRFTNTVNAADARQVQIQLLLQQQLREAGIELEALPVTADTYSDIIRGQQYETAIVDTAAAPEAGVSAAELPLVFPASIDAVAARVQEYRPADGDGRWNAAQWWIMSD